MNFFAGMKILCIFFFLGGGGGVITQNWTLLFISMHFRVFS